MRSINVELEVSKKRLCADQGGEQGEVSRLRAEIDRLYREISDSQNALLTSNEHGDLLQDHLYRLSAA
jgi:hypothetical protein